MINISNAEYSELIHQRDMLLSKRSDLTIDRIVEIANDTHIAMPVGADDHDEMVAIVKAVLSEIGVTIKGE